MFKSQVTMFKWFTDILFPIFCLGCKQEGELVCDTCLGTISVIGVFSDTHVAIARYDEKELLTKIIWALKYDGSREVLPAVRDVLGRFTQQHKETFEDINLVTAIPLHPRRRAERGFNQAEEIAKLLADVLALPYAVTLQRSRYTAQQAKLQKEARTENMIDAFVALPHAPTEKNILIVDDVYTTGATIRAAEAALISAGNVVRSFTVLLD